MKDSRDKLMKLIQGYKITTEMNFIFHWGNVLQSLAHRKQMDSDNYFSFREIIHKVASHNVTEGERCNTY